MARKWDFCSLWLFALRVNHEAIVGEWHSCSIQLCMWAGNFDQAWCYVVGEWHSCRIQLCMWAGNFDQAWCYVVGEWHSWGIQLCGLVSRIKYEAMWLASGIPEVCSYMGLVLSRAWSYVTSARIVCDWWVKFMRNFDYVGWRAESGISYVACPWNSWGVWLHMGWQVESGAKLCGWQVGLLRHLTMWAVSQSAVELCGRQLNFLRYLAMKAGPLDQVCSYVAGE